MTRHLTCTSVTVCADIWNILYILDKSAKSQYLYMCIQKYYRYTCISLSDIIDQLHYCICQMVNNLLNTLKCKIVVFSHPRKLHETPDNSAPEQGHLCKCTSSLDVTPIKIIYVLFQNFLLHPFIDWNKCTHASYLSTQTVWYKLWWLYM